MKKLLVVSLVAVLGMSVAYAFSITVPFLLDNDTDGTGSMGFIGIKNTTEAPRTITIKYFNADALEATYDGPNTFLMAPMQARSWRPDQDTTNEGDGQPIVNGAVSPGVRAASLFWVGTADGGGAGDIVGRYVQVNVANGGMSAYLLPPTTVYTTD